MRLKRQQNDPVFGIDGIKSWGQESKLFAIAEEALSDGKSPLPY